MNKSIINIIIIIIFLIGIVGAGSLVLDEISTGDSCPKFGFIPACYIILACFVLPFIAHLIKKWNFIYFLGIGFALLIASVASIMQYTGNAECPRTSGGPPMCYYSFLIFLILILLKIMYLKNKIK